MTGRDKHQCTTNFHSIPEIDYSDNCNSQVITMCVSEITLNIS